MTFQTFTKTSLFHKTFLVAIAFCVMMVMASSDIFAEAASADATNVNANANPNHAKNTNNLNKMFKGMSPGMQQKMSFLALTTSKIDASEEQKAAIRKQFQRTFQNRAAP
mmetsp:Transcript_19509/g.48108  ORF Transcript_19509/g.48108 Transcript_19509/m.48108 type:complete len:110 (+) Transcript_19509:120-449(+)